MLDCKFSRNEKAATTEATAKTTLAVDNSNGRKPRRASRNAKRHTQSLMKPLILNYSLRKL